jgi:hypothetical protein
MPVFIADRRVSVHHVPQLLNIDEKPFCLFYRLYPPLSISYFKASPIYPKKMENRGIFRCVLNNNAKLPRIAKMLFSRAEPQKKSFS